MTDHLNSESSPKISAGVSAEQAIPKIIDAYRNAIEDRRPWWLKRWAQAVCKHRHVEPWYHAWYCLDCGKVTHD